MKEAVETAHREILKMIGKHPQVEAGKAEGGVEVPVHPLDRFRPVLKKIETSGEGK